jgi:hypothetical protein
MQATELRDDLKSLNTSGNEKVFVLDEDGNVLDIVDAGWNPLVGGIVIHVKGDTE